MDEKVEIFEDGIDLYLTRFCEDRSIEDMRKESQSVWTAALMYIKNHVFTDKELIMEKPRTDGRYRAYNHELLNTLCDKYMYLCMMYDKEITINGFSYLTGIHRGVIQDWGNSNRKSSNIPYIIWEKLTEGRQESLSNKLVTGKQNPVGTIAVLNHFYGWASPYTSDANRNRQPLTAAELPRLGDQKNNEPKQITQNVVLDSETET